MGIVLANGKTVNEGDRFGKWTVRFAFRNKWGIPWAFVECDCGQCKAHPTRLLLSNSSKGCNHCHKQTHRETGSPEYGTWQAMLNRCYRKKDISYPHYGARGITVCDRWRGRTGFANFLADMGRKPTPEHSLDRKEVDGKYEPTNCRWATVQEQNQNKRSNVNLTWNGKTHCVSEWARITGIPKHALEQRVRRGWTTERALTQPLQEKDLSYLNRSAQ